MSASKYFSSNVVWRISIYKLPLIYQFIYFYLRYLPSFLNWTFLWIWWCKHFFMNWLLLKDIYIQKYLQWHRKINTCISAHIHRLINTHTSGTRPWFTDHHWWPNLLTRYAYHFTIDFYKGIDILQKFFWTLASGKFCFMIKFVGASGSGALGVWQVEVREMWYEMPRKISVWIGTVRWILARYLQSTKCIVGKEIVELLIQDQHNQWYKVEVQFWRADSDKGSNGGNRRSIWSDGYIYIYMCVCVCVCVQSPPKIDMNSHKGKNL